MSSREQYQVVVVGGGLAGTVLSWELSRRGISTLLVEKTFGRAALPDGPSAIVNPLPGRTLAPKEGMNEALSEFSEKIELLHSTEGESNWLWRGSILRPIFRGDQLSKRLFRSYKREKWRKLEGVWIREQPAERWLRYCRRDSPVEERDGDSAKRPGRLERFRPEAVLEIGPAFGIWLPGFFAALYREIRNYGGEFWPLVEVQYLERKGSQWEITLSDGRRVLGEKVILAVGADLKEWFPRLPLLQIGGDVVELRGELLGEEELREILIYRGHLLEWPKGRFFLGASYWEYKSEGQIWDVERQQRDTAPLVERFKRMLSFREKGEIAAYWSGVRCALYPQRKPLVGPIPGREGLFILGALGSYGINYSFWLSRLVGDTVQGLNSEPPESFRANRFSPEYWDSPKIE